MLQYDDGGNPDIAPFDINFKDVIEKVINQDLVQRKMAEEKEQGIWFAVWLTWWQMFLQKQISQNI